MTTSTVPYSRMQERVFAFLTDPATHPLVHRIDTHAASVFLEGDRALKIKRAVRFPFLDYSTLEKRKAACDEEIKINRPFAPQIYRRVVPITQGNDGSLDIDGDGSPVEYAIEMARFDERQTIDHLAEASEPDSDLVNAIADSIAASHAVAPRARRPRPGSTRSPHSSKATLRRSEPRHVFQPKRSMISAQRLNRRSCGSVSCCGSVARRDMCGVAMATCIWRTLY